MKKYNIKVNGTNYEVEVEEVGGAPTVPAVTSAPAPATPAPVPAATPKPVAAAPVATPSAGAATVTAPIPGTVWEVKVKPGDHVEAGQLVLILEAMKMENEIFAPSAGTVDTVPVQKGTAVNSGDVLLSIK